MSNMSQVLCSVRLEEAKRQSTAGALDIRSSRYKERYARKVKTRQKETAATGSPHPLHACTGYTSTTNGVWGYNGRVLYDLIIIRP